MITMEMIGKVRRMKLRDQLSNSEIAKRTGLSRNTVKKWLKASVPAVRILALTGTVYWPIRLMGASQVHVELRGPSAES